MNLSPTHGRPAAESQPVDLRKLAVAVEDLRCPETGSALSLAADGDTLVSTNGRRYGRIGGIRSFWTGPTDDALRRHYDESADSADFSFRAVNYLSEAVFNRLRAIFQHFMPSDITGLRALDVGCGHGAFSRQWAQQTEVVGLDFSIGMLRMAERLGLEVFHGDATKLPFRDGLFDLVVCASVLQVVEDRAGLMRELIRVTAPDGLVLLSTLNGDALIRRAFRALMRARIYRRADIPVSTLPALLPAATVPRLIEALPCRIEAVAATMHPLPSIRYMSAVPTIGRLAADSFVFKIRRTDGSMPTASGGSAVVEAGAASSAVL